MPNELTTSFEGLGLRHFDASEFRCHCGCGALVVDAPALRKLDLARELYGAPMVILSGTRCAAHNEAVGGAKRSLHLSGRAFDVWVQDGRLEALFRALDTAGFTGYGWYGRFIHADTGPRRMWTG